MNPFNRAVDVRQWTILLFIGLLPLSVTSAQTSGTDTVSWDTFEAAVSAADAADRYVFVDVYAPWCGWCHKMKQEVYANPEVASYLATRFECTRLNYDDDETTHAYAGRERSERKLARDLNVYEVPGVVILNSNGDYLLHLTGFIEAPRLLSVLRYIGSEAYRDEAYSAFLERTNELEQIFPEQ